METAAGVIVISDNEEDCAFNDSVVIIENQKNHAPLSVMEESGCQDEDLVITFSQRAEVLPHARYDCNTHTFTPTEAERGAPSGHNHLTCDQCYCYVCDRLARQCAMWTVPGLCHCNAHKRSVFWRSSREQVVLGYLKTFNFDLLDIDADLRLAEELLLRFEAELAVEYASFLKGRMGLVGSCTCHCHAANERASECRSCQSNHLEVRLYNYSQVYQCVSSFLDGADRQRPRPAAVMRLGAAQHFLTHAHAPGISMLEPYANSEEARFLLLKRVTEAVQSQLVTCDFSPSFSLKLQTFYQSLTLPLCCVSLRSSLRVRPWDDPLLVAVLRGQNVSGQGRCQGRGRKEILTEPAAVVLLRTHRLQLQNKYRELTRYLKVVQTDSSHLLRQVRDLVPLYQCKYGDLSSALSSMFSCSLPDQCCPACRLSPHLFILYLRIFTTATAPTETAGLATQTLPPTAVWEPIKGALQVRRSHLVRFSLRVLRSNTAVYMDSQCWAYLLHVLTSPPGLPSDTSLLEPDPSFLQDAVRVTSAILLDQPDLVIPRSFLNVYPDQAVLLLATAALALRIVTCPLSPALPVLNAYKMSSWCLGWLCDRLSSSPPSLLSFLGGVAKELHQSGGPIVSQPHPSSPEAPPHWDQPDPLWLFYLSELLRERLVTMAP